MTGKLLYLLQGYYSGSRKKTMASATFLPIDAHANVPLSILTIFLERTFLLAK
jgi:hypothetical protein